MSIEPWSTDGACGPSAPADAVVTHLAVASRVTFGEPTFAVTLRAQTAPGTLTLAADVLLTTPEGAPLALLHLGAQPVGAEGAALEGTVATSAGAVVGGAWVWLTTTVEVPVTAHLVTGTLRGDRGQPFADVVVQVELDDADPGSVVVLARWTNGSGKVISESPLPLPPDLSAGRPLVQARVILPAAADVNDLTLSLHARATRRRTWAPHAPSSAPVVHQPLNPGDTAHAPAATATAPAAAQAAASGPWALVDAGQVDEALALFASAGTPADAENRVVGLLNATEVDRILLGCRLAGALRPKNAYGPLLHRLRHPEATVRAAAVVAVTALGNLGAVPQLNVLKHDPDAGVRAAIDAAMASLRRS